MIFHLYFWITMTMLVILTVWALQGNGCLQYIATSKPVYIPIILAIFCVFGVVINVVQVFAFLKK